MNEIYDYFKYSHFRIISFNQSKAYTAYNVNSLLREDIGEDLKEYSISFSYNVKSKKILGWGETATKLQNFEKDKDIFYVDNIFKELYNIYLNKKKACEYNLHDTILLYAVKVLLQKILEESEQEMIKELVGSDFSYTFVLVLPTCWDDAIREDMLRPLFIQAGLIHKDAHPNRLQFFTHLESNFRYLQWEDKNESGIWNAKKEMGKYFIMIGLMFTNDNLFVDLDLFSVHYPSLNSFSDMFTTSSLKSTVFTIPLDYKFESIVETCLKELKFDMKSSITRKILTAMIKLFKEEKLSKDEEETDVDKVNFLSLDNYYPFKNLFVEKEWKLKTDQINSIKSIPMKKIVANLYGSIDAAFFKLNDLLLENRYTATLTLSLTTSIMGEFQSIQHIEEMVHLRFQELLKKYNNGQYYYRWWVEPDLKNYITLSMSETINGLSKIIEEELQISTALCPPSIIPSDKGVSSFIPNYIINIDILFSMVKVACSLLGANKYIEKTTDYIECTIQPLNKYFSQTDIYQRPLLRITNSMKLFMDAIFNKIIQVQQPSKDIFVEAELKIKEYLDKESELDDFFSHSTNNETSFIVLHQKKYSQLFLILYLSYLNKFVINQLNSNFGNDWSEKKIGFIVTVEYVLLDTLIGSKEALKNMLSQSGIILERDSNNRKVTVITAGERILPHIQKNFDLNLSLKSYFIVAQLYQTYLQVTLHQVVRLSSKEESASSIIIKEEIIHIENVNSTLIKNLWNLFKTNKCSSGCCILDKNMKSLFGNKLNQYISFLSNQKSLNMDEEIEIFIGNNCKCSINISVRNIIDIGMKPAIQNITTIIAASLANTQLFSDYKLDYLFSIGNIFGLPFNSPLYTVYTMMIQKEMYTSLERKEKDTQAFMLQKDIYQLLQPISNRPSYMYDSFSIGNLHQVSDGTYVIFIECDDYKNSKKNRKQSTSENKNTLNDVHVLTKKEDAFIVLRKGQMIPKEGISLKLNPKYVKSREFEIVVARLKYPETIGNENTVNLLDHAFDHLIYLWYDYTPTSFSTSTILLEMKNLNYEQSFEFSFRLIGVEGETDDWFESVTVGKHLTLAYF